MHTSIDVLYTFNLFCGKAEETVRHLHFDCLLLCLQRSVSVEMDGDGKHDNIVRRISGFCKGPGNSQRMSYCERGCKKARDS